MHKQSQNWSGVQYPLKNDWLHKLCEMHRAVASLTVLGGHEFHFPHLFLKFWSILLIFPQTFLIFFLIFIWPSESPTREGPGYGTGNARRSHPSAFYYTKIHSVFKVIVDLACHTVPQLKKRKKKPPIPKFPEGRRHFDFWPQQQCGKKICSELVSVVCSLFTHYWSVENTLTVIDHVLQGRR